MRSIILKMVDDIIERNVNAHSNGMDHMDEWDLMGLRESLTKIIPFPNFNFDEKTRDTMTKEKIHRVIARACT